MAEDDRLAGSPIPVIKLCAVLRCDRAHVRLLGCHPSKDAPFYRGLPHRHIDRKYKSTIFRAALERDPIKCNRITLQIPLVVAQSFGEPLTLRRIALQPSMLFEARRARARTI